MKRKSSRRTLPVLLLACVLVGHGGCAFGPRVLEKSHGRYNESVRQVYEEQLLRNLVHLRYNEGPFALNVASIAAQYELSGQGEARPFFSTEATGNLFKSFTTVLPAASASGSNRPTFTLDPADDSQIIRQFLTPVSADTLAFLTETNWPVSTLLRLYVERINGVPNAARASGPRRDIVPDYGRFQRIAELFQSAQDQELLHLRVQEQFAPASGPLPAESITAAAVVEAAKNNLEYRQQDAKTWVLVRRERRLVLEVTPGAEHCPELQELTQLMNLAPGQTRYPVVVAAGLPDPLRHPRPPSAEVLIETRSTSQAYFHLANGVGIPLEHLKCGLVTLPDVEPGQRFDFQEVTRGLFEVRVGKGHKPPPHAYLAIRYRGYWYYIDDADLTTKSTLALMMQLSRLDFGREQANKRGPVLTLPAGR